MLELRILEPQSDLPLFKEAHSWRRRKRHVGANEATFEDIIDDDPRQITIGVFNGQFCAMFLLYEDEPGRYNAHFSSKRGTSRETLIEAGKLIRDQFMQNGAVELCAWVTERNTALKGYLVSLGFAPVESKRFACQNVSDCPTLTPQTKLFVKYSIYGSKS